VLTVGGLFTGIGGLELGFQRAGFNVRWSCERDAACRAVLQRHFDIPVYPDVRALPDVVPPVDVLIGGDPCPSRSRARGHRPTVHPDLSGWFLAVAGRLRPRWVVRENVPAPDVVDFALGLEALGYGVVAFALDARDFTAQSRRREFLVGCPPAERAGFAGVVSDASDGRGFAASSSEEEAPVAACLTAHPARMAAEDSYVFEPGRGLRLLDSVEAEALQGFPRDWTAGFSRSRRRRMVGNAVNVRVAEWIAWRIIEWEHAAMKEAA
jgi:DNA (cytosine-5)-methyltransferase 1